MLILATHTILGASGCAPTASPQSIRAAYADQLEQLQPGTDLATFKRLVPKAKHFDTMFEGGQRIDIYRLDHQYKPDEMAAKAQTLYFFFSGERLVRWGNTGW
jgi:hypothetical protein